MKRWELENELKNRFHEAQKEAYAKYGHNPYLYTPQMIRALVDMAKADVYPDGHFGDTDCNVWSMFR